MTGPDSPLRRRRLGLYAPFVLLLLLFAAVTMDWECTRAEILQRLAAMRTGPAGRGVALAYGRARLYGFPFRLDLDLQNTRLSEPSGWAISTPQMKAEAYLFSPAHWVVVAPVGLVIDRRQNGPLIVRGKALRASLAQIGARPPRLSVEGLDLTFATPPGARPFALASAGEFHLHTKGGPNDQGALYLSVVAGRASEASLLGRIAAGGPVDFTLEAIWSRASKLAGSSWPGSLRNWAMSGGRLNLRRLEVTAGRAAVRVKPGLLTVGPDGRLSGQLSTTLVRASTLLNAMVLDGSLPAETARAAALITGAPGSEAAVAPLDFQAGQTTLGPVALGPAPRLF